MLEALTYRYRGHSVADAGLAYRSKKEIAANQSADPIARTRSRLLTDGVKQARLAQLEHEVAEEVAAAVAFAEAEPEPPVDELATGMYAPGIANQFERMRPGSPFGELALSFDAGLGQ